MNKIGIILWIGILCGIAQAILSKEKGLSDWNIANVGDVQYAHFYYAKNSLQGIFVVSNEGTLALINHNTGGLIWRKPNPKPRDISHAIFDHEYALIVTDNKTNVELWKMGTGTLIAAYALSHNPTKAITFDAIFLPNENDKHPAFALLTNDWLKIYKNLKESKVYSAELYQTNQLCFYDFAKKELFLIVKNQQAHEIAIMQLEEQKNSFVRIKGLHFQTNLRRIRDNILSSDGKSVSIFNLTQKALALFKLNIDELFLGTIENHFLTETPTHYVVYSIVESKIVEKAKLQKALGKFIYGLSNEESKLVYILSRAEGAVLYDTSLAHHSTNLKNEIKIEEYGVPLIFWHDDVSGNILIKTKDRSLHHIINEKKKWTRQESLSNVMKWAIREHAPEEKSDEVLAALSDHKEGTISSIAGRIRKQVSTFKKLVATGVENAKKLLTKSPAIAARKRADKKYIFALTKYSKVYAINSVDGDIMWQKAFRFTAIDFHYFKDNNEDVLVVLTVNDTEKTTTLTELYAKNGGLATPPVKMNTIIKKCFSITSNYVSSKKTKLLILIGEDNKSYVYPSNVGNKLLSSLVYKKLTLCDVDKSSNSMTGFRVNPITQQIVESWKIDFKALGETILATASDDNLNRDEFQVTEESNGNIIYKYVNPNLIAVATYAVPNHFNIYIINRVNGAIIYTGHIYNVHNKESVKIAFSENSIMVSYMKKYSERHGGTTVLNEILAIEMYFPQIENDFQEMIMKHWNQGIVVGDENSNKLPNPIILTQTYVLPIPIKDIAFTTTKQGITNKHILVMTTNNHILTIPGTILNARRPTGNPNRGAASAYENSEFPPYDTIIPIVHTQGITYDLQLNSLTSLIALPHEFESTTLVLATGVDVFANVLAPEKRYDRLSTEFKHWYIFIAVVGIIIVVYVMSVFARKKEAKELYLAQQ